MEECTGRTLAMVKNLPKTGSIVVVHSENRREYIIKMIYYVQDINVFFNTKVVSISDPRHIIKIRGISKPIFIDHAFYQLAPLKAQEALSIFTSSR